MSFIFIFQMPKFGKIKNITSMILDVNFPSDYARKLYLYKKDLILSKLLTNFRKRNYLQIEGFANFTLDNYYLFLEDVIEKSAHIYFSDTRHVDLINYILNNLLK